MLLDERECKEKTEKGQYKKYSVSDLHPEAKTDVRHKK
jgi:hypothetical protein